MIDKNNQSKLVNKCALINARINMAKYERMIQNGAMGGNTTTVNTIHNSAKPVRKVEAIPYKYNDPEGKRYIHIPEPEISDDFD